MLSGAHPETFVAGSDQFARSAVRLTLRQAVRVAQHEEDVSRLDLLAAWRRVHDAGAGDTEAPGH